MKDLLPFLMVGGAGLAVYLIARHAQATRYALSEEGKAEALELALAECGFDRQCRMRAIYAAEGRSWDWESSPEYVRAVTAQREEALRAEQVGRWPHLFVQ